MLPIKPALPPNADPLLPSQHTTALDLRVEANSDSLSGIDFVVANKLFRRANMNSLRVQRRCDNDPLLVSDYLRVRNDETLSLHPVVCQVVAERHHDQLLEDIVKVYHSCLLEEGGTSQSLKPVPGFPEPALDGLNGGYDLVYLHPEFELDPVEDRDCDGRKLRPASDYPIQIHDILADLRAKGIVTSLAKSGCDACGHKAGRELADRLRSEGYTVNGYAGIAAETHPKNPLISVQDFEWNTWESGDVVDLVEEVAGKHGFRSDIRVEVASVLRC